jgi:hypothetical protein
LKIDGDLIGLQQMMDTADKAMKCAEGSLAWAAMMAHPDPDEAERIYELASKELIRDLPLGYESVFEWNDEYLEEMEANLWRQKRAKHDLSDMPLGRKRTNLTKKITTEVRLAVGAAAADQFRLTADRLAGLL